MGRLTDIADVWEDTITCNTAIVDTFTELVNEDAELKAHRDFVEKHVYGFGERAFYWAWKLMIDSMPQNFSLLEIGVYKGQVLSLVRLLASRTGRMAGIVGITPLSSFSGVTGKFTDFPDEDYMAHIGDLHRHFRQRTPTIIEGDSTDLSIVEIAKIYGPYDIVYIDACHEVAYVTADLLNYMPCVKVGGLLVMDDSACDMNMPWGYFQGIEDVCIAVRTILETNPGYEHLLACMHLRIWRKLR